MTREDLAAAIPYEGDALIIVPPFAGIERPSLAAHLLQAVAAQGGFRVEVLYANLLLAAELGEAAYQELCFQPTSSLLGERLFASAAFPAVRPDFAGDAPFGVARSRPISLEELAEQLIDWAESIAAAIATWQYRVVGCTSSYEQGTASLALLHRLKRKCPDLVTILGGANYEGEMAAGWAQVACVDHIFSGESERTFYKFLHELVAGRRPSTRIIRGTPLHDLDSLPPPRYESYYRQLKIFLPDSFVMRGGYVTCSYETSRGCWWGQKNHCTFCGLNGEGMAHRAKSPDKVQADLQTLMRAHPTRRITMTDNIMPYQYFRTLVPALAEAPERFEIFYEQKANLSLNKVRALEAAGIKEIQPGIEALSTPLLRLMKKGVTAGQNLALLRYVRSVGVRVSWNLLYAFPNDRPEHYEETLRLLPLIQHLPPPSDLYRLSIDRFSPYFDTPAAFGIRSLAPLNGYAQVFPSHAALEKLAYHFTGDYDHAGITRPDVTARLKAAVQAWIDAWRHPEHVPALTVARVTDTDFVKIDTRAHIPTTEIEFIDANHARATLIQSERMTPEIAWAVERGCSLALDGKYVPLAVASPNLIAAFENEEALSKGAGADHQMHEIQPHIV